MAWKEILDEEKIGIAGGLASLDSNQKLVQNVPNSKVDGLGSLALKSSLAAADIPNLAAGKITSGTFGADRIPTLPQSKITDLTNTLAAKVDTTRKVNNKPLSADVTLGTNDLIASKTTLPATGNEGEIIRFGSALYVWKG